MSIVRKSLAAMTAVAMMASATVASAQSIRPSDSLVSASPVSAVQPMRQGAALAEANNASTTTWVLVFIVVGTIVVAIWIAVDSDDEPESPN